MTSQEIKVQPIKQINLATVTTSRFLVGIQGYARNIMLIQFGTVESKEQVLEILKQESDITCQNDMTNPLNIQIVIDSQVSTDEINAVIEIVTEYFDEADLDIIEENIQALEINKQAITSVVTQLQQYGFTMSQELAQELNKQSVTTLGEGSSNEVEKTRFTNNFKAQVKEIKNELEMLSAQQNPILKLAEIASTVGITAPITLDIVQSNPIIIAGIRDNVLCTSYLGRYAKAYQSMITGQLTVMDYLQMYANTLTTLEQEVNAELAQEITPTANQFVYKSLLNVYNQLTENIMLQTPSTIVSLLDPTPARISAVLNLVRKDEAINHKIRLLEVIEGVLEL